MIIFDMINISQGCVVRGLKKRVRSNSFFFFFNALRRIQVRDFSYQKQPFDYSTYYISY